MREIRLEIVPRPEGGVAIIYEKSEQLGEGPYITGEGEERDENRRLLCGNCGHMLANNLRDNVIIQDIIFRCNGCNSYNKSSG
jgi:hypothetical protein